jgi:mRNA interferase RelE/StbE
MRYELRIPRRAAKQLASLPSRARSQIIRRVEGLANWPAHGQDVKALRGRLEGCYRLRCGEYRVLFQVLDDARVIVIEKVAPRGSVYH